MNFELIKYKILSSLCAKRFNEFEHFVHDILKELESFRSVCLLSERDQKALNQINLIFKKFDRMISLNCSQDFYSIKKNIKNHMVAMVRHQVKQPVFIDYETWRKNVGLNNDALRIMLANVSSLQLSVGCSNFCRRCNEWALPGVRKHFTFDAAIKLVTDIFKTGNNEFSLYSASDPLDWKHKNRDITDILEIMRNRGYRCQFGLLTKVPKGSGKIVENLLKMHGDFAVSITDKNRKRIKALEKKTEKKFNVQHDSDELLIPAGMDEDFKTIKSSITDNYGIEITPEGASIIVPAFTSALNLTGQKRISVDEKTQFFLKKQVGINGLTIEYFKPLQAVNLKKQEFTLSRLLDSQVENIMLDRGTEDQCTPPGMISLKEYFKTFENQAASMRQKMIPVIEQRLKKEFFSNSHEADLDSGQDCLSTKNEKSAMIREVFHINGHEADMENKNYEKKFQEKFNDYLDFCRPETLMEFKKFTFSFFLKAIMDYIKKHSYVRDIVLHLRKQDKQFYTEYYNRLIKTKNLNFTSIINTPDINEADLHKTDMNKTDFNTFDLFQIMMFKIIDNPYNKEINEFIKKHPSMYNPITGRFTACKKISAHRSVV